MHKLELVFFQRKTSDRKIKFYRFCFRLENSPYAHLLDDSLWHEISEMFVKDACALMGLSIDSPLSVVVNAGSAALPALLNIKQVYILFSKSFHLS